MMMLFYRRSTLTLTKFVIFFSLIFLLRLSHLLFVLPHAALHKFNKQKYKTKQKIKQDLTSPKVKTWWRFARKNSLVIHRFPFCVSYLFACFAYHSFEMINICLCFVWVFFFFSLIPFYVNDLLCLSLSPTWNIAGKLIIV